MHKAHGVVERVRAYVRLDRINDADRWDPELDAQAGDEIDPDWYDDPANDDQDDADEDGQPLTAQAPPGLGWLWSLLGRR